jgi:2'-5' RNA ligase
MPSRPSIGNTQAEGPQPGLFDTSLEIFRYLVVISPSQQVIVDVAEMKSKVAERIGPFRGDRSKAHMTLLYMYLPIEYEGYIMNAMELALKDHHRLQVHYQGIHLLPDRSTIYIDVLEKDPIIEMRRSIKQHLQRNKSLKKLGINATSQPMLTIARKLDPVRAAEAMEVLSPHTYEKTGIVDEILLLRGRQKEGERYEIAARCALK